MDSYDNELKQWSDALERAEEENGRMFSGQEPDYPDLDEDDPVRCPVCESDELRHTPGTTGYSNLFGEQEAPGWYECQDCSHIFND
ncbi:hypothetical protein GCM10027299_09480 [Larkinella ripae]